MKNQMLRYFLILLIFLAGVTVAGGIYKWVDEQGKTIYSDTPPPETTSEKIKLPPQPPKEVLKQAQEELKKYKQQNQKKRLEQSFKGNSMTLKKLGPLPDNISTKYLSTVATGVAMSPTTGISSFHITLKAKFYLPIKAYLEVQFDNPENPDKPFIVEKLRQLDQQKFFILSPDFKRLKCWNYQVKVYVFKDKSKNELLSIHAQTIQSRVNIDKMTSAYDIVPLGKYGGLCP